MYDNSRRYFIRNEDVCVILGGVVSIKHIWWDKVVQTDFNMWKKHVNGAVRKYKSINMNTKRKS